MRKVKIAGLDGSLRNFGIAKATLDLDTMEVEIEDLVLIKTEKEKSKKLRASSDNLLRAKTIADEVKLQLKDRISVFAEVPSGGQDYRSVLGFGIVTGIYASLNVPLIEVSQMEAKTIAVGTKTASKAEMIEWAFNKFPNAPWRTRKFKGDLVPTSDNEHLADAVAIIYAGMATPVFQQTLAILRSQYQASMAA